MEAKMADTTSCRTGVVFDERLGSHYHKWNDNFTEKPERLKESLARCRKYGLIDRCKQLQPRSATEEEMRILHSKNLVQILKKSETMSADEMKALSRQYDFVYFHEDIYKNSCLSLGCCLELLDEVVTGKLRNGMAIVRPPGHHAMHDEFSGYCHLNNVATAAKVAIDKHGMKRVLIVDWDVHHGQGTQYFFYDDPRVIYFSVHSYVYGKEWPYLRESDYDHIGEGAGKGFNINVPLNEVVCGNSEYLQIFQQILLPIAYEFNPDLVLVSAGYDAALGCPEGEMEVTPACFAHFVNLLSALADGKICLMMEGGYCIKTLAEGVALSLRALLGDPCPLIEPITAPFQSVQVSILNAIKVLRCYWNSLQYQGNLISIEASTVPEIAQLPPLKNMTFYSDHTRPRTYSLSQECYDPEYDAVAKDLESRIDLLIQNTSLSKAPNKVCVVYDEAMMQHKDTTSGDFAEYPERIQHIYMKLKERGLWDRCMEVQGRIASDEELALAHSMMFINQVKRTSNMDEEALQIYQNTFKSIYLCQESYHAASLAVGSLLSIVDNVLTGRSQSGLAVIRPPGHHAESNLMMGFCLFNNIGIAAKYAQTTHMVKKILILDWDIHHGNALQSLFYDDPSVLYISLHRYENGSFYPYGGGGNFTRSGGKNAQGYNINVAWNDGSKGDADYIAAFQQIVMPISYEFCPDLVLVAAGFDAADGDTMGNYRLTAPVYAHMTQMLMGLANGKVILSLEGGYKPETNVECISACVSKLLGDPCPSLPSIVPSRSGVECICKTIDEHKQYWKTLAYRVDLLTEEQILTLQKEKKKENVQWS